MIALVPKVFPWIAMAALAAFVGGRPRRTALADHPTLRSASVGPFDLDAAEPGRGRAADAPWRIPAKGWKDIVWRTYQEMGRSRLTALAGGATYFLLLATFPAIAAFVSIYGLFSNVATVESQLQTLAAFFPRPMLELIGSQMIRLATERQGALGAAFAVSVLLSLWSANGGMKSLFSAVNVAYGEREKRDYFIRTLITYAATLSTLLFATATTLLVIGAPVVFGHLGVRRQGPWWIPFRWAVLWLIAAIVFTLLYRYAPSRTHARWRWVAPGGALAAILWISGSLLFSWYIDNFTHFGVTYGSLGAMIGYMLWVWVSMLIILLGAELNSEIEHQTAIDTTIGPPAPMGERGAVMADTLGAAFTVSPKEGGAYIGAVILRQVKLLLRRLGVLKRPIPPIKPPG
ncbi:MAG: YihY/virulence factor BrkB family protein, partial [Caulobacteraceae bacterium]